MIVKTKSSSSLATMKMKSVSLIKSAAVKKPPWKVVVLERFLPPT